MGDAAVTSDTPALTDPAVRRGGAGVWARSVLLALVAVAGLAGVTLALAPLAGWNTVVLVSGSMSPSYPAGSVLFARQVSAGEVAPGDVVMVTRVGAPPVTHRVVAVEPVDAPDALDAVPPDTTPVAAVLTLKGDANRAPDPEPYRVDRVGLVAGGIPWGGQVFALLRSPWMIGALSLVIAAFVLWSWWPRRRGRHAREQ